MVPSTLVDDRWLGGYDFGNKWLPRSVSMSVVMFRQVPSWHQSTHGYGTMTTSLIFRCSLGSRLIIVAQHGHVTRDLCPGACFFLDIKVKTRRAKESFIAVSIFVRITMVRGGGQELQTLDLTTRPSLMASCPAERRSAVRTVDKT